MPSLNAFSHFYNSYLSLFFFFFFFSIGWRLCLFAIESGQQLQQHKWTVFSQISQRNYVRFGENISTQYFLIAHSRADTLWTVRNGFFINSLYHIFARFAWIAKIAKNILNWIEIWNILCVGFSSSSFKMNIKTCSLFRYIKWTRLFTFYDLHFKHSSFMLQRQKRRKKIFFYHYYDASAFIVREDIDWTTLLLRSLHFVHSFLHQDINSIKWSTIYYSLILLKIDIYRNLMEFIFHLPIGRERKKNCYLPFESEIN